MQPRVACMGAEESHNLVIECSRYTKESYPQMTGLGLGTAAM